MDLLGCFISSEIPFYVVAELSCPMILGVDYILRSGEVLTQIVCIGIYSGSAKVGVIGPVDALIDSVTCIPAGTSVANL